MRKVFLESPGNLVVKDVEEPTIIDPTDAIISIKAACVCGSDL